MRIAICTGNAGYGKRLRKAADDWAQQNQLNIRTGLFLTGEEILADIEETGYYDIVLMDSSLQGSISGMETAGRIRRIYEYFCLIFMSAENVSYREVLNAHPYQYLEKPVSKKLLWDTLNRAAGEYHLLYETFVFRFKGMSYCIRLSEVLYFASDKRVIRIYMEDGRQYCFYEKLDELEKKLEQYSSRFFRIHQSYLISGRQVEQYHPKYVIMRNREVIPVSMDRREKTGRTGIKNYIYGC